ncbi:MAG TPA: hypothetical protein VHG71_02945 [Verrucomicrobiae bacterium]|nr:hypothetical protein [Verrucomicrobiae bacterium]
MNIFQSRKLTDAEFVEKIRKQLQKSKYWAWFMLFFSGAMLVLFFWFLYLMIDFAGSWSEDNSHDKNLANWLYWYRIGLATGACFGGFAMLLLVKVFWYFCEFLMLLTGNRRDKLLVDCYDQLHPLDAKAPAPSSIEKFSH